jgi:two-component system response regulator VanR
MRVTRKQFAVLEVLVAAEGGVVNAEELLRRACALAVVAKR